MSTQNILPVLHTLFFLGPTCPSLHYEFHPEKRNAIQKPTYLALEKVIKAYIHILKFDFFNGTLSKAAAAAVKESYVFHGTKKECSQALVILGVFFI
jgi:hypothetical protein